MVHEITPSNKQIMPSEQGYMLNVIINLEVWWLHCKPETVTVLWRTEKDVHQLWIRWTWWQGKEQWLKQSRSWIYHLLRSLAAAFPGWVPRLQRGHQGLGSSPCFRPIITEYHFVPWIIYVAALGRKQMVDAKASVRKKLPRNRPLPLTLEIILYYFMSCSETKQKTNWGRIQRAKIW